MPEFMSGDGEDRREVKEFFFHRFGVIRSDAFASFYLQMQFCGSEKLKRRLERPDERRKERVLCSEKTQLITLTLKTGRPIRLRRGL